MPALILYSSRRSELLQKLSSGAPPVAKPPPRSGMSSKGSPSSLASGH
ncbi:unnamed protein product [Gulo gulo]|uniref:Uncharacterized protein n=1 Tax=Gulo gulo TaxID=48420 RepID=A0A9X9QBD5_GULGU|nr:unnamed protein product [Gulo gulo]